MEALKEINDIIQNVIWEGKTTKIPQNTLIKNINEGGLKFSHYPTKVKALKLSWIKRLCDANWKCLPKHFYNCNDHNLYFFCKPQTFEEHQRNSVFLQGYP